MAGGLTFKFSLKDMEARKEVNRVYTRMTHVQEMLKKIGLYMLGSIHKNFQEGGRPIRWKPSWRAIRQHGQTLLDTGRLLNSITMRVYERVLKIGTNVKYAAIHQFGGRINKQVAVKAHVRYLRKLGGYKHEGKTYYPIANVRAHQRKVNLVMPQRKFLLFQNEDYRVINRISEDHIAGR